MLEKIEIRRNYGFTPDTIKVRVKKGKLIFDRIDSENAFFIFDGKSSVDAEEFSKGLEQFKIADWANNYNNPYVLDGEMWTVVYKVKGEKVIEKIGSNAWPKCWEAFIKYVYSVVDEKYHTGKGQ